MTRSQALQDLENARRDREFLAGKVESFATMKRNSTFAAICSGRQAGMTWSDIGDELGMRKQSVMELHARVSAERDVSSGTAPTEGGSHE